MTKRLFVVAALAGALVTPLSADAQILRTWCTAPAGDACFNVTGFEFAAAANASNPDALEVSYSLTGLWEFAGVAPRFGLWGWGLGLQFASAAVRAFSNLSLLEPGIEQTVSGNRTFGPRFLSRAGPLARDASLDDVNLLYRFEYERGLEVCSPNGEYGRLDPCFRPDTTVAPEPSTWILLGTGLVGVGWVARRRREQQPS